MATTIKLKNSVTATNAPSSLVQGEVAINVTDKKVWVGNAATTPIQLLGGGADGSFTNISVSSVATFGAGTVSAPAITTTGDTNTGIFFPAADTIAFTEGGVESMRIDSSGNVGIGTSSPNRQLSLTASSEINSSSTVYHYFGPNGTNLQGFIGYNGNGDTDIGARSGYGISFKTVSSGAVAETMRLTASGNLGIGTSSPVTRLHVLDDLSGGQFIVSNSQTNSALKYGTFATQHYTNAEEPALCIAIEAASTENNVLIGGALGEFNAATGIKFYTAANNTTTAGTERMRIDSSGNLLVGTTTSIKKLTVSGEIATTDGTTNIRIGQSGGVGLITTLTNHPLVFQTNDTERMRIDSSGNLLVGTTSRINTEKCIVQQSGDNNAMFVYGTSTTQTADVFQIRCASTTTDSSYKLLVANNGSGTRFQVFDSGNVQNTNNSYGAISDAKLKENIVDATPKLDDLMKVKVRHYNLIGDENKQIGVVAQELESVFAGLVEESIDTDREGNDLGTTTKAVKYSVFVPMLIKAIQELKAEVDSLKQQLGK